MNCFKIVATKSVDIVAKVVMKNARSMFINERILGRKE